MVTLQQKDSSIYQGFAESTLKCPTAGGLCCLRLSTREIAISEWDKNVFKYISPADKLHPSHEPHKSILN